MPALSRSVPRFLPTLTEVVHAPVRARAAPGDVMAPQTDADQAAIAESVRVQVEAEMEGLFRDAVTSAMLEQVDVIAARLREEIEPVLRQAVAEMVANEIAARRHN